MELRDEAFDATGLSTSTKQDEQTEVLQGIRELLTDESDSIQDVALEPGTVDVGTTATLVVPENLTRAQATVRNTTPERMYLGWTPTITPENAPYYLDENDIYSDGDYDGDIYALVASGSATAAVQQIIRLAPADISSEVGGFGSQAFGGFPVGT